MADGNSHPFNENVIATDTIVQLQKPLPHHHYQQQHQTTSKHKDLIDLLSSNNTSNHVLNSKDNISSHAVFDNDFNRLKSIIRSTIWPIDDHIRRTLWMNILTLNRVRTSKQHRSVHHTLEGSISTVSIPIDYSSNLSTLTLDQWPNFVDETNLCFYHLIEPTGYLKLQRILFTFSLNHPDLTYCPTLEPISCLLLHYFNEHQVLYLMNRLLLRHWLCAETRLQWEANCNAFQNLLKLYYKSTADSIELRYKNTKVFYQEWFWWIFRYLPFSYLVKIMDCFLLEGPKVLYRISLALVHLFIKAIKHKSNENIQNMADFCQQIPVSIEYLLHVAFRIRNLKRSTIEHLISHEQEQLRNIRHGLRTNDIEQNNGIVGDRHSLLIISQHITHKPKISILDHQQFVTLWNWLPARLSLSQPVLVFTTQEHGFRLRTLLEKVNEIEYSILIIKATNGEIFGAFCAGLWSDRQSKTYFGFGETYLFTLVPKQIKYPWVGQQQQKNNHQYQVKKELFLFVNDEKLTIGGGNGDGLSIDSSLSNGHTAHCETFNNEPLCSLPYFSISVLEIITFDFLSS